MLNTARIVSEAADFHAIKVLRESLQKRRHDKPQGLCNTESSPAFSSSFTAVNFDNSSRADAALLNAVEASSIVLLRK